jgi:hypothetical protein
MRTLEERMPLIAEWLSGDQDRPLGADLNVLLRKCAMKTHVMLCFMQGMADKWGDEEFPTAVIPPMTPAKELYRGDEDAVLSWAIGGSESWSRWPSPSGTR